MTTVETSAGRVSPPDPRFKAAIQHIVEDLSTRRHLLWIGFDNCVAFGVSGEDHMAEEVARQLVRHWGPILCFKALMVVQSEQGSIRGSALLLGLDAVYTFSYDTATNRVVWIKPDDFDAFTLRQLKSW